MRHGVEPILWAPDGSAKTSPFLKGYENLTTLTGEKAALISEIGLVDLIHDSGLWKPHNHLLASISKKLSIPRILSIRGMLQPRAVRYKRLKKTTAWLLYQKRDIQNASALHVTSDEEKTALKRLRISAPLYKIPNGVEIPNIPTTKKTLGSGTRTVLYLGRLHPIKGLPLLIDAWWKLQPDNWRLIIAGPSEVGHGATIADLVKKRKLESSVEIRGPQHGAAKKELLSEADLFVLPSRSENFGIAVAEALAHGIPTITTTGAPWNDLLTYKCGWQVEINSEALRSALQCATAEPEEALLEMGERGKRLIKARYSLPSVAQQTLSMYRAVVK